MNLLTIRIGDLIIRKKGPFSTHYMVYIGWHNGIELVAENQIGVGVRYVSLQEALAGNSIKRFEKFGGTEAQRQTVISRINAMLGKAYDLMVFNCEHFARWIANGKTESKQVKTASTLAITAGAAMLAHKSDAVKVIGGISIFAGLMGHLSQS
jgi:hypothetical protein